MLVADFFVRSVYTLISHSFGFRGEWDFWHTFQARELLGEDV